MKGTHLRAGRHGWSCHYPTPSATREQGCRGSEDQRAIACHLVVEMEHSESKCWELQSGVWFIELRVFHNCAIMVLLLAFMSLSRMATSEPSADAIPSSDWCSRVALEISPSLQTHPGPQVPTGRWGADPTRSPVLSSLWLMGGLPPSGFSNSSLGNQGVFKGKCEWRQLTGHQSMSGVGVGCLLENWQCWHTEIIVTAQIIVQPLTKKFLRAHLWWNSLH